MRFVHLHNHTEYSLLDGAMKIDRMTERAANYEMPALAITDHGNMFGAIEFYISARKLGIKPIIGIETYIAPRSRLDQSRDMRIPESSFHLTLLCENEAGYKNLIKLSSLAFLEGFYYKPRIDKELLSEHCKGLIGLSGCLKGEIPYKIAMGDLEGARKSLAEYVEIFGPENFNLEIMRLGMRSENKIHGELIKLAHEFDVPIVATNDCHYLDVDDYKAHDVLLCIGTKKTLSDRERLKFESHQVYFRSPQEMARLFDDLPEAISNTSLIAEKCNLLIDTTGKDVKLPSFPRPANFETDFDYLRFLTKEGITHRFPRTTQGMQDRLDYELGIIKRMGLSGYFLIVREIVEFARQNGIPTGPGRGSAVGSLVLYSLGITDIDPLQYNLIFERFLNPERVSLPDIDADFGDTRRDEIIDFIKKRYGEKNVTQVITFGTMQARAVVRDVGRVMGIPYNEIDRLAKLIPFHSDIDEAVSTIKELETLILSKEEYKELFDIARKLEGLARHPATHAAGVVITPKELVEYVPLYKSPERGEISTQYAKNSLEDIGVIKMDILGLRTLTVIEITLKMIARQLSDIPIDDKDTYDMLKRAETVGVFQLESQGMKDILRNFQPERFEDIIAVIALYRPGPMANVNLQQMIANKQNPEKIEYMHPWLEPILRETYGMIVYQEQVIQIASRIAGFSLAEADMLRRAMGKKIADLMVDNREKFIGGAVKNGVKADLADQIFKKLIPFAGYGFNKSHAAAYAALANQTAYLKCHYPLEFMNASLNSEINNTNRLWVLVRESRRMGLAILPPDINTSNFEFKAEGEGIRYGLGALKNLGRPIVETITTERSRGLFKSFFDFQARTKGLNKKSIESLIKAGAFREFESDVDKLLGLAQKSKDHIGTQTELFGTETSVQSGAPDKPVQDRTIYEKEAFGFYFTEHPLERFQEEFTALGLKPINQLGTVENGEVIAIGGILNTKKIKRDKNGRNYAIINLADLESAIDVFIFSDHFERFAGLLKIDNPLIIKGRISGEEDRKSIRAEDIVALSDAWKYYKKIFINFNDHNADEDTLKVLCDLINDHQGECEVWFKVNNDKESKRFRSRSLKISPDAEVIGRIKSILGKESLKIYGKI
ncbi:MAG: DNA polymerase III subunit alpha [candidate division WOR-3 bacterium]|nr:MAG: DNA polymerase III subunit alpha [candidate division WOR-3 bacterium]